VLNSASNHKDVWGSGGDRPTPLAQYLYRRGNTHLIQRRGNWVGLGAGMRIIQNKKNLLPLQRFEPTFLHSLARSIVTILMDLLRLMIKNASCPCSSSMFGRCHRHTPYKTMVFLLGNATSHHDICNTTYLQDHKY
jgi:hypothetical protein